MNHNHAQQIWTLLIGTAILVAIVLADLLRAAEIPRSQTAAVCAAVAAVIGVTMTVAEIIKRHVR